MTQDEIDEYTTLGALQAYERLLEECKYFPSKSASLSYLASRAEVERDELDRIRSARSS